MTEVPGWSRRQPPAPVVLEGRYVRLEPIAAGHAEPLFEALCGPEDAPLWTYRPVEAPRDVAAMARDVAALASAADSLTFAIVPTGEDADGGRAAGMASYLRIDPGHGSIEDLGYRRLEWKCDSLNEPSRTAAFRLGFEFEGRFRQHLVIKGRNRDTDWFSITDAEWPAVGEAQARWLDPANFDDEGRQRTALSSLTSGLRSGR